MSEAAVNFSLETSQWLKALHYNLQKKLHKAIFYFSLPFKWPNGSPIPSQREFYLSPSWGRSRTDKSWKETIFVCFLCSNPRLISFSEQKHWQEKLEAYMNFHNYRRKKRVPAMMEQEWLLLVFSGCHPFFFQRDWFENKWSMDVLPHFFYCNELFSMWH